jgi:hypothetical protein
MKFCFLDNNIKKSIKRIITWSLVCILISIIEYFIDGSYSIGYLLGFIIIGSILILIMRISSWQLIQIKFANESSAIANFPKICTNKPLVALTFDAL